MFKFVVLAVCVAAANAGFIGSPLGYAAAPAYGYAAAPAYGYAAPAVGAVASIGQNTYRSFGNTAQVSTYSKALDTPFSSVRKSDVRVSNPGYAVAAAPAYAAYHAAPASLHAYLL
ncbi:hypothetical protein B566_EDAN010253 [Ephemera danica]|nr:hypothetical protein B566_EDAN010253 [Ephemera danica]